MAQAQGSPIHDAWTTAIASYKRDLNPKRLQEVQTLTSPQDIVSHMKNLEKARASSASGKLVDRVKAITDRLVRFSRVVDVMTTSNSEASLIWGSLKLLLTIAHQSSEVYGKICDSLEVVDESLQVVDLLAETFAHSQLVSGYIVKYYCSILHFWRKAIKHYRRKKIINLLRGVWHDYDSEFGNFEEKMKRLREEAQKAAHAVDMSESMKARQQQDKFHTETVDKLRTIEELKRHGEIVKWLTPVNRDARYYVDDLESARKTCHPGTCKWIFKKPEFEQWLDNDGTDSRTRMLWVYAIAGAGKTVLAGSIIAHYQTQSTLLVTKPLLYFFFKNTDDEKNSLLSMTRSFLHQLYVSAGNDELNGDLISLKEGSGNDNMRSDEQAWDIFLKHAKTVPGLTIVLDALDECKTDDIAELLERLCSLAQMSDVRVVVMSRKYENIHVKLESWPCIQIQQEDVNDDIGCFVEAKVGNMARLNSKSLRDRIVRILSSRHEGMFLWAFLMIKELKSLATIKEVEERLTATPGGLEDMHRAIVLRLSSTLSASERLMAIKILTWVVSAIRPLRLVEIREMLRFEIKQSSKDNDLLYSEKDIELICGSLVTNRHGVLQLIHLSTKEILQQRPAGMDQDDPCWPFFIDVRETGPQIAVLCVSYISTHQTDVDSYTRPGLTPLTRLEPYSSKFDITQIWKTAPFIEYAYVSWQAHLVDGEPEDRFIDKLHTLLTSRFTTLWLEFRLAQDPDSLWNLERSCMAMQDWVRKASVENDAEIEKKVAFLKDWCNAVLELLKEYGLRIRACPDELHYLDIESIFSSRCLPEFDLEKSNQQVREQETRLTHLVNSTPKPEVKSHRLILPQPEEFGELGFFLYDEKRDAFYYSEEFLGPSKKETLWVQDRQTGRRLPPARKTLPQESIGVKSAVFSRDWRYLAILYQGRDDGLYTTIWEIEDKLDFNNIKHTRPWARRHQILVLDESWFNDSCCPLTAGPDDLFCTPSGLVDPYRGIRQALPVNEREGLCSAFSGDGRVLFFLDSSNRRIDKVFWLNTVPTTESLDLSPLIQSPLDDSQEITYELRAIDHDGNRIVIETEMHADGRDKQHRFYMMHTVTHTVHALWHENNVPSFVQSDSIENLEGMCFWNKSLIMIAYR